MRVTELALSGFRNLDIERFLPSERCNVIYGENGQGKTNLLEAIGMFSDGHSFRGAPTRDILAKGATSLTASLTYMSTDSADDIRDSHTLEMRLGEQKGYYRNTIKLPGPSAFLGGLYTVVFSPEHLSIVKAGPEERRSFLDIGISQLRPRYSALMREYNRLLKQRNSALRQSAHHPSLRDTLEVWDRQLANIGERLIKTRRSYIDRLSPEVLSFYDGISSGREALTLQYLSSSGEVETAEELFSLYERSREQDIRLGRTSIGVHRDDLALFIDGIPAKHYASQGQQRSVVLALKLAESSLFYKVTGERPVVLLDDVLSELDETRQAYLLGGINDRQLFITSCHPVNVNTDEVRTFYMREGRLGTRN